MTNWSAVAEPPLLNKRADDPRLLTRSFTLVEDLNRLYAFQGGAGNVLYEALTAKLPDALPLSSSG
jgi:hypothetical protein